MNYETGRRTGSIAALAIGAGLLFIIAGTGLLPPVAPVSAAESTSVSMTVPATVLPGSNFTATINVSQVVNFDAASYDISFDPAVLRLNSVTSGSINGKTIPIDSWNNREPGRYTVVGNVPGLTGVSGNGSLAVLQFSVIGSLSNSTSISFSNAVLGNILAQAIQATWTGALIQPIPPPPTVPASFSLSDFSVSKREVGLNEPVAVSVLVTNTGGSGGTLSVILKVNGVKEAQEDVVLGAVQIRTVSWLVARSTPGAYAIDVNGQTGQFTVAVPPAPPPPFPPGTPPTSPPTSNPPPTQSSVAPILLTIPPPSAVQASPPAPISVPGVAAQPPESPEIIVNSPPEVTPAPAPQPPPPAPSTFSFPSFSWLLLGGIGGAIIVIGLVIFLAVSRRL